MKNFLQKNMLCREHNRWPVCFIPLLAGLLGLALPSTVRAEGLGQTFEQNLTQVINQVKGLIEQAEEQGAEVPELNDALMDLNKALTQPAQRHEHHPRHQRNHEEDRGGPFSNGLTAFNDGLADPAWSQFESDSGPYSTPSNNREFDPAQFSFTPSNDPGNNNGFAFPQRMFWPSNGFARPAIGDPGQTAFRPATWNGGNSWPNFREGRFGEGLAHFGHRVNDSSNSNSTAPFATTAPPSSDHRREIKHNLDHDHLSEPGSVKVVGTLVGKMTGDGKVTGTVVVHSAPRTVGTPRHVMPPVQEHVAHVIHTPPAPVNAPAPAVAHVTHIPPPPVSAPAPAVAHVTHTPPAPVSAPTPAAAHVTHTSPTPVSAPAPAAAHHMPVLPQVATAAPVVANAQHPRPAIMPVSMPLPSHPAAVPVAAPKPVPRHVPPAPKPIVPATPPAVVNNKLAQR